MESSNLSKNEDSQASTANTYNELPQENSLETSDFKDFL